MIKVDAPRNNGVTIAKAIAIILMVMGHSCFPKPIVSFIYLMHMPLFFIMSGYCFKPEYLNAPVNFLKRRAKGVYIPYVKWALIFLLLHNLFCYINIYNTEWGNPEGVPYTLWETMTHAGGIIVAMIAVEELLGGYWFLHELFWGSAVFFLCMKAVRNRYSTLCLLLSASIFFSWLDFRLSYFVNSRTLLSAFFLMVGHVYREGGWKFERSWEYIVASFLFLACVNMFWHTSMENYTFIEVVPYALCAVVGSLMIFGLGQRLDVKNWKIRDALVFIGNKTLNVLTWHLLSFKIVSLAIILLYGLLIERLAQFTTVREYAQNGWNVVYLLFGLGGPVLGSLLYPKVHRYFVPSCNKCMKMLMPIILSAFSLTSCSHNFEWTIL